MKMTVGPLPAGVYWRRRAIVGGVLLIVVLMLWASCGRGDPGDNKTSGPASGAPTATATATAEPTIQVPTTGEAPTSSAPPSSPPSSAPAVTSTVPLCADADLSLTAAPEQPVQFRGAYLKFFLRIKNTSNHDCVRDLGADFQELYLQVGASKIWSSDQCDAPHGTELKTLKPGIEVEYSNTWNGKATNNGCENREVPPAGKYQLVGRLDTKISEPVNVQLT
ncbi:hypothetical protein KZZ52_01370 [Dactylosporangium sp. AC04546]|uniref:hypothetical protein n=1 Tax=Dactylosporangium sp. AC04546 TaxID=2862460 RepID=UPI001EDFD77F|nr:hypothetical protein [Dactylosporangium sp. AC04546]WVK84119.1 hypothetical protein KZZ52_01370 [Dactylosporangium sp. AC04546]